MQTMLRAGMDVLQFKVMARILEHVHKWRTTKLETLAQDMYGPSGDLNEEVSKVFQAPNQVLIEPPSHSFVHIIGLAELIHCFTIHALAF
jgi:hypothetical protein